MQQVQKLYQEAIVFAAEKHTKKNQKIPGTNGGDPMPSGQIWTMNMGGSQDEPTGL